MTQRPAASGAENPPCVAPRPALFAPQPWTTLIKWGIHSRPDQADLLLNLQRTRVAIRSCSVRPVELAMPRFLWEIEPMSNRDIAIDLIQKLPPDASLHDIAREIEFVAGVREGFEQMEHGEGLPAEEVRKMVPSWIVK
jgi:hypothetical protein